ncbi:NACHT domain-containing protein [Terriglobus sp. 2YAB30_2]|uniref:NACHT domain-containing protein n=2 Tax=unclassified Terriglobus TaxID=2628988 RepID=UPI003F95EFDB
MNSIKGELESAKGQVAFVCGRDLFDLFRQHWTSYIYFESNLLSLYLSSLAHLDENSAFSNLMTRGGFTIDGISSLSRVYIPQNFRETIPRFTLASPFPGWRGLDIPSSQGDLRLTKRLFEDSKTLIQSARLWSRRPEDQLAELSASIDQLSDAVSHVWKQHYQAAVDRARDAEELSPSERKFVATSLVDRSHDRVVNKIETAFRELAEEFQRMAEELSRVVPSSDANQLRSEPYLIFSRLKLASIEYPWVVHMDPNDHTISFDQNLLDKYKGPLLIAGAAGYGKTSFCRMATLRDSTRFAEKSQHTLPVYVQLYRLNTQELQAQQDPVEAFIDSTELRRYVYEKLTSGEDISLRFYLDGLDEVTDVAARTNIMRLARIAAIDRNFQIVVTSREHVVGSNLDWLPRLSLAPFDDVQMATLAHKWLDKAECARFLSELDTAGELKRIIRVPLLANLTLAIFKEIGALPESTTRLYEMFVQLLCGGWDSAKNIRRDSEFGAGPKRTVITRVAWMAHNSRLRDFTEADFKSAVGQTLSGLTARASVLLRECIHDGILIRGGDRFAFAHLSFQEFLVANHLNDPRGYRQRQALREYLEGDSWWTEVMRFFIAGAEDPNETAKWIVDVTEHISGRGQSHPTEIKSRADELIDGLEAHHKGFRPEKRTKKSLQRLKPR